MSDVPLPRRELAPGHSVCRLIHGGWQLSAGHRPGGAERGRTLREMAAAVEAGATTFDGADIYTGVEELYGELIRRIGRDAVEIHTKLVPDLEALPTLSRHYVERIVDRSLRRLGVDRLDLVQFHWWDFAVPGHVESVAWLDDLRRAGKVRSIGVTNYDREHLAELLDAELPVVSNQVQYSLLDRRPELGDGEETLVELCLRRGVSLLCYGTLAGGLLAAGWLGRPDPGFEELPNRSLLKYRLIVEELGGDQRGWSRLQRLLATVAKVARRHEVDPSAVASRWVLDRPGVAAVIVGWSGLGRFEANRAALDLVLDEEDRAALASSLDSFDGPGGPVYGLERNRSGRHGRIMRYDLNRSAADAVR